MQVALIFWTPQFRFYQFSSDRRHLLPKRVSPKSSLIYNTQRALTAVGSCLQWSEQDYSRPDISWDNKPVVKTSPLNGPKTNMGKSGRLFTSGSTFWSRNTNLRVGSVSHSGLATEDVVKDMKMLTFQKTCDIFQVQDIVEDMNMLMFH